MMKNVADMMVQTWTPEQAGKHAEVIRRKASDKVGHAWLWCVHFVMKGLEIQRLQQVHKKDKDPMPKYMRWI